MASRSSWAARPGAAARARASDSSAERVLVIFDLLRVLLEVEHEEPAVSRADDAEQQLALPLRELEGRLVGLADVLQGLGRAVADLGDDVEGREAAEPG